MHYSFRRDIVDGKRGEAIVKSYLERFGKKVDELPPRNPRGDLVQWLDDELSLSYEVKYDLKSRQTGNMCFEIANGKGQITGIAATKADYIVYVVPNDDGHTLYLFVREKLYDWLFNSGINHRIVNGGDKKKFSMILVPLDTIDSLDWCERINLNA